MKCDAGDTLCVAEVALARLKSATSGIQSLVRIDIERQGIVDTQEKHLALKDKIIADYEKIDRNSQRIDTNSIESARLYQAQISDDKLRLGDLQHRLDSCQGNQKWIALMSAVGGGFIGYKLHGVTSTFQNPFANFAQSAVQPIPLSTYQTTGEALMRRVLKANQ